MLDNDHIVYSALGIILKDTGIVTDAARAAQFPAPLANTAHASYLHGVQSGFLKDDDSRLVRLYMPPTQSEHVHRLAGHPNEQLIAQSHGVTNETISDLLAGIHLAAAVECMAFCQALGQSREVMCEIVLAAAGWNAMFSHCIPGMVERDRWSLADCADAEDVGRRLSEAVDKCRKMRFPCPMAATALQQFHFSSLAG